MFESHHIKLIQSCYPKYNPATPLRDLKPDSNNLSQLECYAAARPKMPKVIAALRERAGKHHKSAADSSRADLAVTLEIVRGLVLAGRTDLACFGETALRICDLGLSRKKANGERDVELEARAAGIVSGPSVAPSLAWRTNLAFAHGYSFTP